MSAIIKIDALEDNKTSMSERKGIGHPDTICDEIMEQVSVALCKYYLYKCGMVLHHNVDKALLIGGAAIPSYGGGKIVNPMTMILAGRASFTFGSVEIPVHELAIETTKDWLRKNIRHLNVDTDIEIISKIRPGSSDLKELFNRFKRGEIPLANDTSFGVGFYPTSTMEKTLIDIEEFLNSAQLKELYPFVGEDIKVMGVEVDGSSNYTIAIAMVDRYITNLEDYISKIDSVKKCVAEKFGLAQNQININTADDYEKESVYLTVTGTSAESGDDGQVGRGNRINGLITPYHPMSLEAASGKNPISHVGKIYNYFAMDLSKALVEANMADYIQIFIVSQIGKPIDEPQLLHIRGNKFRTNKSEILEYAKQYLSGLPQYWSRIIDNRL